jgi:uncharacterized protein
MNSLNDLDTQPWYKQGWPWALIAIPFLTVVAGVITFIIANNTSDSLVLDDYYKKGLAINSNIERLEKASVLQISAKLTIDDGVNLVTLNASSISKLPETLQLTLAHPTLKNLDQTIELNQLTKGQYVAEITPLVSSYWHISVEDKNKTWLLKTRWLYPDIKELEFGHEGIQ